MLKKSLWIGLAALLLLSLALFAFRTTQPANTQPRPTAPSTPTVASAQAGTSLFDRAQPSANATAIAAGYSLQTTDDVYSEFLKYRNDPSPDGPAFALKALYMCQLFSTQKSRQTIREAEKGYFSPSFRRIIDRCQGFLNIPTAEWKKLARALEAEAIKRAGPASLAQRAFSLPAGAPQVRQELAGMVQQGNLVGLEAFSGSGADQHLGYLLNGETMGMEPYEANHMLFLALRYAICDAGMPCGPESPIGALRCQLTESLLAINPQSTLRCTTGPDALPAYNAYGSSMSDMTPTQQQFITHWRKQFNHAINNRDPSLFAAR
ncbi:hypothetical protein GCM10007907_27520 [Chitinimonas prasina]|uniref:DUF4375 domain-containing protein n=1 Tax=Chitinimonas prasina TaxID=1434937 RepID=A0ABQ5YJV1_9NEIS|nr:hypothetical protein [Chitinimonas prasina]GLR13962.1 hypothetical protein GCM10007907_27520 [Chitinimonas prasina]